MSNILKDYLDKRAKDSLPYKSFSSQSSSSSSSGFGGRVLGWFKSSGEDESVESSSATEETVNGWFSDAQKDPLLPSLETNFSNIPNVNKFFGFVASGKSLRSFMSKKQRIVGFFCCILMGTLCLSLASLYIPFLVLKARKFALLYSLGSLFVILSFSMLWGPVNHMKHLFSPPRLAFSLTYLVTMAATLYFALSVQSMILTVVFAVLQVLALVWYLISYIPGGQKGLQFFSKLFYAAASKTVQKTLPV